MVDPKVVVRVVDPEVTVLTIADVLTAEELRLVEPVIVSVEEYEI